MKKLLLILTTLLFTTGVSANNIVETTSGQQIQLNDDGTFTILNEVLTTTITCKAGDSERIYFLKNVNGIQQALGEDYTVTFTDKGISLSGRFEILLTYTNDYIINGKNYGTCSNEGLKEVAESFGYTI